MKKYKVISLFSGGMGLDLGLEQTGSFELLACVEKEAFCCETIRLNRENGFFNKRLKVFESDICNLNPNEVLDNLGLKPGELDLLVGGPPCQSFSTAGKRGTTQDPRGTLLWQFLRYVKILKPKFFLMENVRGLLSAALKHRPIAERPDKGGLPLEENELPGSVIRLFAKDLKEFEDTPYHMDCFEVNSVNYGAPQIRERVLFVGNRYGQTIDFPLPTHGPPKKEEGSSRQKLLFPTKNEKLPWATLRDAIGNLKEEDPQVMDFSPRKKKFLSMVPEGSNWRSLPIDIQKESMGKAWYAKGGRSGWWRRLTFDLPSPTLVTMPNHSSTSLCHPVETRALSVREYARIQEFPDAWKFSGKLNQQYSQIGNAVPLRLGFVAGTTILESLDKLKANNWQKSNEAPENYRVVYIQSHIRTRRWYKDGKTFVWNSKNEESAAYQAPKTKHKVTSIN